VTKADITESIIEKAGFSRRDAAEIVDLVFETIKEALGRGDKIKIYGFGNFVTRQKKSRVGRNPQTGEPLHIAARRAVTFQCSELLKNALRDEPHGDAEGCEGHDRASGIASPPDQCVRSGDRLKA